jgi:hypothetical protein
MSIELAIEKAVERAFQQHLEPLLAQFAKSKSADDLEETFWDTARSAKYLNVAPATMAFWRFEKRGPQFQRFGSAVRYRKSALDSFIEANAGLLGKKGRPPKAPNPPVIVETNGSVRGRRKQPPKYLAELTGAPSNQLKS